jgi:HK97 gp10 family phage protein
MSKQTKSLNKAIKDVDNRIQRIIQAGVSSMYESANEIADLGKEYVNESIRHEGTYKQYVDKRGNVRMSSAPGEPPASAPGNDLDKSIYSKKISKRNANPAIAEFGSTSPYARALEYGTEKMAPRPFMRPAAEKLRSSDVERIVVGNFAMRMARKIKSMRHLNVRLDV